MYGHSLFLLFSLPLLLMLTQLAQIVRFFFLVLLLCINYALYISMHHQFTFP
ncbi:hypothetical protein BKA69DRAFT_1055500 [Paraphysoderma sedebokerense]|nr:hypothetical protein BKA69DRAFT_1055500 [Paraphysoderma sedebokerense]